MDMPDKIYVSEGKSISYCASDTEYAGDTEYTRSDLVPQWISVEDIDHMSQGWCVIKYNGKGQTITAFYDRGNFYYNPLSNDCYLTECIEKVFPLPPLEQE